MLHRRDEQCRDWLCSKGVVQASVWRVLLRLLAPGPGTAPPVPPLRDRPSGTAPPVGPSCCAFLPVVQTADWLNMWVGVRQRSRGEMSPAWLWVVPVHRLVLVILLSCSCASALVSDSAEVSRNSIKDRKWDGEQSEGEIFCLLPPFHLKHGGPVQESGPQKAGIQPGFPSHQQQVVGWKTWTTGLFPGGGWWRSRIVIIYCYYYYFCQ